MITKLYNLTKKIIKENLVVFIVLILSILMVTIKLPYSIYAPGGIINLDNRIDGAIYNANGSLNMTYVSFIEGKIPTLLLSLFINDWDIVKDEDITITGENLKEMNLRERIYLKSSISNALYMAYSEAGINYDIVKTTYYVAYVSDDAKIDLKVGDIITNYDNFEIKDINDFYDYIKGKKIDDEINLKVTRNNKVKDIKGKIIELDGVSKLGIIVVPINEYSDETLKYHYKDNESGSSGGLMMSLAFYNALVEEDITKGKKISGTGTIERDGTVGEIGGVKYKLAGAVKNKSDVFLVPKENYEEAIKEKEKRNYNIKIIRAENFKQVIDELKKL